MKRQSQNTRFKESDYLPDFLDIIGIGDGFSNLDRVPQSCYDVDHSCRNASAVT